MNSILDRLELKRRFDKVMEAPSLIFRAFNRAYHTRLFLRDYNTKGCNVFEEDWDNLVILDACRFELFRDRINVEEFHSFEHRISRGSNSFEFVRGNFFSQDLTDVAYLTANGHIYWMEDELDDDLNLYALERFERMKEGEANSTFMPSNVRKQAEDMLDEYEDKRVVIHFMQPHAPFLDDEERFDFDVPNFWDDALTGKINPELDDLWDAYGETLDKVWREVLELQDELDGKTVVTSDHGHVFGERVSPIPMKEWGHPQGIYDEKLVKVPWLVIDEGDRRDTVKEDGSQREDYDEEEVKKQLADLGYNM